jgi:hypothetical protein
MNNIDKKSLNLFVSDDVYSSPNSSAPIKTNQFKKRKIPFGIRLPPLEIAFNEKSQQQTNQKKDSYTTIKEFFFDVNPEKMEAHREQAPSLKNAQASFRWEDDVRSMSNQSTQTVHEKALEIFNEAVLFTDLNIKLLQRAGRDTSHEDVNVMLEKHILAEQDEDVKKQVLDLVKSKNPYILEKLTQLEKKLNKSPIQSSLKNTQVSVRGRDDVRSLSNQSTHTMHEKALEIFNEAVLFTDLDITLLQRAGRDTSHEDVNVMLEKIY